MLATVYSTTASIFLPGAYKTRTLLLDAAFIFTLIGPPLPQATINNFLQLLITFAVIGAKVVINMFESFANFITSTGLPNASDISFDKKGLRFFSLRFLVENLILIFGLILFKFFSKDNLKISLGIKESPMIDILIVPKKCMNARWDVWPQTDQSFQLTLGHRYQHWA